MRWSVPIPRHGIAVRSPLILSAAALASATALLPVPAAHAAAVQPAGSGFGRATQIRLPVNAGTPTSACTRSPAPAGVIARRAARTRIRPAPASRWSSR
jgi:hypothetical protein